MKIKVTLSGAELVEALSLYLTKNGLKSEFNELVVYGGQDGKSKIRCDLDAEMIRRSCHHRDYRARVHEGI